MAVGGCSVGSGEIVDVAGDSVVAVGAVGCIVGVELGVWVATDAMAGADVADGSTVDVGCVVGVGLGVWVAAAAIAGPEVAVGSTVTFGITDACARGVCATGLACRVASAVAVRSLSVTGTMLGRLAPLLVAPPSSTPDRVGNGTTAARSAWKMASTICQPWKAAIPRPTSSTNPSPINTRFRARRRRARRRDCGNRDCRGSSEDIDHVPFARANRLDRRYGAAGRFGNCSSSTRNISDKCTLFRHVLAQKEDRERFG